jgi:kynurenine formamidase
MSEFIDLTRPFDTDAEHSLSLPDPEIASHATVTHDGVSVQCVNFPTHVGTHVDAPSHIISSGATVDEYSLSQLTGEGVVIGVDVNESRAINRTDLRGVEALREGDAVLLSFEWASFAGTTQYHRYPWCSTDLADWLLKYKCRLLGMDTLSPDEPRASRDSTTVQYPVHRRFLSQDVPIVENLADPSALIGERVEVVCAPLHLCGGDGAPCRVFVRPLD